LLQRQYRLLCVYAAVLKKLMPDKFFVGKPSQNYRVSPNCGVTEFYLQPDISKHTPP